MNHGKTPIRHQFDFEIGYLIKSPCRNCFMRFDFPGCMAQCDTLDLIQTRLAGAISSCRSHSPMEGFRVDLESRRNK